MQMDERKTEREEATSLRIKEHQTENVIRRLEEITAAGRKEVTSKEEEFSEVKAGQKRKKKKNGSCKVQCLPLNRWQRFTAIT